MAESIRREEEELTHAQGNSLTPAAILATLFARRDPARL
jgi:hypothetical protein